MDPVHGVVDAGQLDAGGRFHLAKDSLLSPAQTLRSFGDRLSTSRALRQRLDPDRVLRAIWPAFLPSR